MYTKLPYNSGHGGPLIIYKCFVEQRWQSPIFFNIINIGLAIVIFRLNLGGLIKNKLTTYNHISYFGARHMNFKECKFSREAVKTCSGSTTSVTT